MAAGTRPCAVGLEFTPHTFGAGQLGQGRRCVQLFDVRCSRVLQHDTATNDNDDRAVPRAVQPPVVRSAAARLRVRPIYVVVHPSFP